MRWNRVEESMSFRVFSTHITLICFTLLLSLKLDHVISYSWWIVFFPLFIFHAVVARGSFPLSLPSVPDWEPFHARVATRLLVAFEVLLCFFLETAFVRKYPNVSLKIVFFPLLAFEIIILFDNLRILKALLNYYHTAVSEALPFIWVAISMGFFVAATVSILQKLCGDIHSLRWWNLFIIFAIAECFAFLTCITWSNPIIPILGSQILLLIRLEEGPAAARFIPFYAVLSPIFLAQGIKFVSASNLTEKIVSLVSTWLLFWRSSDEGSREEQAYVVRNGSSGYNTFSGYPPEMVKNIPKKNLTVEIWKLRTALSEQTGATESSRKNYERLQRRLQAALNEQTKITESSRQHYERPQNRLQAALNEQTEITESSQQNCERPPNEKLCTICYERERNTVLLPCKHHTLCSNCSEKCKRCPICRAIIKQRMRVFDV